VSWALAAVALLLAGVLGFVLGRRSSPPTQAVPAPPRPADVPGAAEEARRDQEAHHVAEEAAHAADPAAALHDAVRGPGAR
jgi:hypothetical protein